MRMRSNGVLPISRVMPGLTVPWAIFSKG